MIENVQLHFSFRLFPLEQERHAFSSSSVMLPPYPPLRHVEGSDAIAFNSLYQQSCPRRACSLDSWLTPFIHAYRLCAHRVNFQRSSVRVPLLIVVALLPVAFIFLFLFFFFFLDRKR